MQFMRNLPNQYIIKKYYDTPSRHIYDCKSFMLQTKNTCQAYLGLSNLMALYTDRSEGAALSSLVDDIGRTLSSAVISPCSSFLPAVSVSSITSNALILFTVTGIFITPLKIIYIISCHVISHIISYITSYRIVAIISYHTSLHTSYHTPYYNYDNITTLYRLLLATCAFVLSDLGNQCVLYTCR